ncbi:MAG: hypothetical protein R2724_16630 [Bryobacterales bacterium]
MKGPPKPGDRWRVGMYCIERPDGLAAYKKGSKMEKSQFLAWALDEEELPRTRQVRLGRMGTCALT